MPIILCYRDWLLWFASIRISKLQKEFLEVVFLLMWWHIWLFRNNAIFGKSVPKKSVIFIVLSQKCSLCVNIDIRGSLVGLDGFKIL